MSSRGLKVPDPAESDLARDVQRGHNRAHPIRQRIERYQRWAHDGSPLRRVVVRALVAVIGCVLLVSGVAMLVLPGPGWVFIFLGIGVWSMEFDWAHRLNQWALKKLSVAWARWHATPLMQWWLWCVSGTRQQSAAQEYAAYCQAQGHPVRFSARNHAPGATL